MNSQRELYLVYGLLGLATLGYCWLIWLVSATWGVFATFEPGLLSRLTIAPLPWGGFFLALPWQLLALISWVISYVWARRHWNEPRTWIAPVAHMAWLLTALIWHGVGALYPYISFSSQLI